MYAGVRHVSAFRSGIPSAHPRGLPGATSPVALPGGPPARRAHLSSMHPALTPRATAAHPLSRLSPRLPSAHRHLSPAIRSQPADDPLVRGLFPQAAACVQEERGRRPPPVKGVGRGGGQGGPQCGPRSRDRRPWRGGQAAGGRTSAAAMPLSPIGMHFARRADLRESRLWPRLCTLPRRSSALRRRFPAALTRRSTAP